MNILAVFVLASAAALLAFRLRDTTAKPLQPIWGDDLKAALAQSAKSGKPVFADFDAPWCGPCRQLKRQVFNTPEFAREAGKFLLVEIDTDQNKNLVRQYGVGPIPDIRFISQGVVVGRVLGFEDTPMLVADMETALQRNPAARK